MIDGPLIVEDLAINPFCSILSVNPLSYWIDWRADYHALLGR